MRGIAGLIGAGVCGVLLSTCGTYRAIVDDYRSDAPVVQEVKPTAGVSGENVTFQVFLCEGKLLTGQERYIWDFGGGAYPNVSFDAEPSVQLRDGLRSPYDATVTITGGCIGDPDLSSVYEFTLNVAPLSVFDVTPQIGTGRGTATFAALIGVGNVTSWQWDFGGACNPGGSTEENPQVVFVDVQQASIFNGRVIVSNPYEYVEFPFQINVLPNPAPST
jgi:hypothetical protein